MLLSHIVLLIFATTIIKLEISTAETIHYWQNTFAATLENAFYRNTLQIYLTTNNTLYLDIFSELFASVQFAISYHSDGDYPSQGYLIVGDDFQKIKNQVINRTFKVQRTLYIAYFLNAEEDIPPDEVDRQFREEEPFKTLLTMGGLDIGVNKIYVNFATKWQLTEITSMVVTSLRNGTSFHEKLPPWKPDFKSSTKIFKIIAFFLAPHVYYSEQRGLYGGWEKDMMELVMNWTQWHYKFETRSIYAYNIGALQEIVNGNADASIGGQLVGPSLNYDIDRTNGHFQACLTFLVRKPERLPLATFVFQPFNLRVWCYILVGVLVLSALYNIKNKDLGLSVLRIQQVMFGSCNPQFPRGLFLRIITAATAYSGILFCTMYMASYASTFRRPRHTPLVETLDDLLLQENTTWAEYWNSSYVLYGSMVNDRLQPLLDRQQLFPNASARNAQIYKHKIFIAAHVLGHGLIAKLDTLNTDLIKRMMLLKECYGKMYGVIPLAVNSPFRQILDEKLLLIREYGFIELFLGRTKSLNIELYKHVHWLYTPYSEDYDYADINLEVLSGAFYWLAFGLGLSIIVFFIEVNLLNSIQ